MPDISLPALMRWFGDSVAKDPLGLPQVLYHSTSFCFDVFDTRRSELGTHVGTIEQANSFGNYQWERGRFILPIYIRLENPLRLIDTGYFDPVEVAYQLASQSIIPQSVCDELSNEFDYLIEDNRTPAIAHWIAVLQRKVVEKGFDGFVYLNRREGLSVPGKQIFGNDTNDWSDDRFLLDYPEARDSYILFEPWQIKSALSNNGDYRIDRSSFIQ